MGVLPEAAAGRTAEGTLWADKAVARTIASIGARTREQLRGHIVNDGTLISMRFFQFFGRTLSKNPKKRAAQM
jgi:hypothetical protein